MMTRINKILLIFGIILTCCLFFVWRKKHDNESETIRMFTSTEEMKLSSASSINYNRSTNNPLSKNHDEDIRIKRRFPNSIIIGTRKSGTRALLEMLRSHPLIEGATSEIHFFNLESKFKLGVSWYIKQMPKTKSNELTIEKSPKYFIVPSVPKRIHDLSKDVKLILIVRNPVSRAVSDYLQRVAHNEKEKIKTPSFENIVFHQDGTINSNVSEIDVSMYDVHYERWLKLFNKEQIYVVNGDDLVANPFPILKELETFLNIRHYFEKRMFIRNSKGFYCWKTKRAKQPTCLDSRRKGRNHPNLSTDTVDKITEFLKPHATNFCYLASVKFSWCSL